MEVRGSDRGILQTTLETGHSCKGRVFHVKQDASIAEVHGIDLVR